MCTGLKVRPCDCARTQSGRGSPCRATGGPTLSAIILCRVATGARVAGWRLAEGPGRPRLPAVLRRLFRRLRAASAPPLGCLLPCDGPEMETSFNFTAFLLTLTNIENSDNVECPRDVYIPSRILPGGAGAGCGALCAAACHGKGVPCCCQRAPCLPDGARGACKSACATSHRRTQHPHRLQSLLIGGLAFSTFL